MAADGHFSVAQLVSGVPAELGGGDESAVSLVLSVADGRAHLALDADGALAAGATATIALGYADALALALGRLDPADTWRPDACACAATWPPSSRAKRCWRRRRTAWGRRWPT